MLGVTLWNTIIEYEWFEDHLKNRLEDSNKTTNLLFLQHDGDEIKRRKAEGRREEGLTIDRRAEESTKTIVSAIAQAKDGRIPHPDVYRTFDYSPTVNWMRFDKQAFVVLFMYKKGGHSPAIWLDNSGVLFLRYSEQFKAMWKSAGNG